MPARGSGSQSTSLPPPSSSVHAHFTLDRPLRRLSRERASRGNEGERERGGPATSATSSLYPPLSLSSSFAFSQTGFSEEAYLCTLVTCGPRQLPGAPRISTHKFLYRTMGNCAIHRHGEGAARRQKRRRKGQGVRRRCRDKASHSPELFSILPLSFFLYRRS